MSDQVRYRTGETNPTPIAYKAGVALEIGDFSWLDDADSNTIKPASSFAWTTDLATTQTNFVLKFVGVNTQRWDGTNLATGNKDGTLLQHTSGIHEFATAANTTLNPGDFVGPDASGTKLLNQQVVKVATKARAIGVVERAVTSASSVRVRVFSNKYQPIIN